MTVKDTQRQKEWIRIKQHSDEIPLDTSPYPTQFEISNTPYSFEKKYQNPLRERYK